MSENDFNLLIKQSNSVIQKLYNYKKEILKNLNWKIIWLKEIKKNVIIWKYYFQINNYKITVNTNDKCFIEKDFLIRKNWIQNFIYQYYKYKNNYNFIYISKNILTLYSFQNSDSCINNINNLNNSFSFLLNTNKIWIKQQIFWKLWASYLKNQYKNLILLWDDVYLLTKNIFSDNEKDNNWTNNLFLWFDNSFTYINWNKNKYFDKKYIKKYNKSIIWYKEWFFWNWYAKTYINRENFLYLWKINFLKNNLYYFYKYLLFMINHDYIIWKNSKKFINIKVDNVYPKLVWEINKKISDRIEKIEKIVYQNNFKNMKDIYNYIENQYTYDTQLMKQNEEYYREKK